MSLPKAVTDRLPEVAGRVIQSALEAIVPTVDMDPKKVDEIVAAVEDAIISVISSGNARGSGVISCAALSYRLRMIAERSDQNPAITAEINGIAQSIAYLVGSRNGASRGLRALEPRVFEKEYDV